MKKIGLSLVTACFSFLAIAQTTVNIYSTGALGSFTTGNATTTTRNDNSMIATATPPATRGYAVFSLASIPATAVVTNVEYHFNVEGYTPGFGMGASTRGVPEDLSLETVPATLFTKMTLPTADIMFTAAYPFATGNFTLLSEPGAVTFIDNNIGNVVSVASIIPSATRIYTITGETGVMTTSGVHAPYLRITYNCPAITGMTADGPPATAIPCPNQAFALTGAVAGATDYLWTGPLGFSSTMLSPTVSTGLPSTGVYTFTATDVSGCSAQATATVFVNPAPSTTITAVTNTAFCEGGTLTLDAPVVPGHLYQWYNGSTAIPAATDATYIADTSGNYKVQITDVNGCTGITTPGTPVVELINPAVTPGDTVLLCNGDNGTLTVNTNGVTTGLAYQWQKNGVDIPGAVSNNYVVTSSGLYRTLVNVTATTCSVNSKSVLVDVNDYPLPTVTYAGSVLSTSSIYAHFQWFVNTVALPGATSATLHPPYPGSYIVRVTDANGCTAFSGAYAIGIVGVNEVNTQAIRLYPNPVNDVLRIESPIPVQAIVSSIDGKALENHRNAAEIDLHAYPAGLYLITLYNEAGDRIKTEKITKK